MANLTQIFVSCTFVKDLGSLNIDQRKEPNFYYEKPGVLRTLFIFIQQCDV